MSIWPRASVSYIPSEGGDLALENSVTMSYIICRAYRMKEDRLLWREQTGGWGGFSEQLELSL